MSQLARSNLAAFVTAGRAVFTVLNTKTGGRFTFQVTESKDKDRPRTLFVKVLTGPDNTANYEYIGFVREDPSVSQLGYFVRGSKSRIDARAPSVRAFAWFWQALPHAERLPPSLEVYHEGRCARCGRVLTVPESVASGFGPECAGKMARAS